MPVVTVASPKGGSGKSTASVILGTELAHAGAEVVILDCDPNRSITIWSHRAPPPSRIAVRSNVGESEIVRTIKQEDADGRIVIVDLEGVASRLVSRAISQADLVLDSDAGDNTGCNDRRPGAGTYRGRGGSPWQNNPARDRLYHDPRDQIQTAHGHRSLAKKAGGRYRDTTVNGARRLLSSVRIWR